MEVQYTKDYSPALGREMEMKIYGHAGRPVLFIPCQDGRFYDFENFKMTDYWGPYIESGQVMVFSVDTIDRETWSDQSRPAYDRVRRYEAWISYLVYEAAPFIQSMAQERNGGPEKNGILVFGCSLGATHAANLYFRFPRIFTGLLALSGIYTSSYGFGGYMDEVLYLNSPVDFIPNMPADHEYIGLYNQNQAIICVGQGAWEMPDMTRELQYATDAKGIRIWYDYWGYDCSHDWPWWYKQVEYFVPKLLESM